MRTAHAIDYPHPTPTALASHTTARTRAVPIRAVAMMDRRKSTPALKHRFKHIYEPGNPLLRC